MRIDVVEIDEENVEHRTRHGVTTEEITQVFDTRPAPRRNRRDATADYYVVVHGIRVNFLYNAGVVRPVSAWRVSR